MTWIVGTPLMFGYGFAVSDIRVTWGTEWHDCLQKIHTVGRHVALGFAGSVEIGFAMIETMKTLLDHPDETKAWNPKAIAEWWPQDARDIFDHFPDHVQAGRCELILLAVHPSERNGNFPVPYVYRISSPNFIAGIAKPHELLSIGCGSFVPQYGHLLTELSTDLGSRMKLYQGEVGTPGGAGSMIGDRISNVLRTRLDHGISRHLNYCWVEQGKITIKTNNRVEADNWTIFPHGVNAPNISELADIDCLIMPELATTSDEFKAIAHEKGLPSGLAVA
jgi:hypothetical protein